MLTIITISFIIALYVINTQVHVYVEIVMSKKKRKEQTNGNEESKMFSKQDIL